MMCTTSPPITTTSSDRSQRCSSLRASDDKARKPTKLPHSKTISPKAAEIEPDVASDPRIKLADDITRAKQGLKVMGIDYREAALHHIQDHDHESSMKQKRVEDKR
ncbi:hypothetical protein Dimus_001656 [Dionaea muscipula]